MPFLKPRQLSSEGLECPICFTPLTTENAVLTRCGHMFTGDCVEKLGSTNRCPTCNQSFTRSECVRVYNGIPSGASHFRDQDKRFTLLRKFLNSRHRAPSQNRSPPFLDTKPTSNAHLVTVTGKDIDVTQESQTNSCSTVTDCPSKHSDFSTHTLRLSNIPSNSKNVVSSSSVANETIHVSQGSDTATGGIPTSYPIKHSDFAHFSFQPSSVSRGTVAASTQPALPGTLPPPPPQCSGMTSSFQRIVRQPRRLCATITPKTQPLGSPRAQGVHVSAFDYRRIIRELNRKTTEPRIRRESRARRRQLTLLLMCIVIMVAVGPDVLLKLVRNLICHVFVGLVILFALHCLVGLYPEQGVLRQAVAFRNS